VLTLQAAEGGEQREQGAGGPGAALCGQPSHHLPQRPKIGAEIVRTWMLRWRAGGGGRCAGRASRSASVCGRPEKGSCGGAAMGDSDGMGGRGHCAANSSSSSPPSAVRQAESSQASQGPRPSQRCFSGPPPASPTRRVRPSHQTPHSTFSANGFRRKEGGISSNQQ